MIIHWFAPELTGKNDLTLKVYSLETFDLINTGGDALTEDEDTPGLFEANVTESIAVECYCVALSAVGALREGYLADGDNVIMTSLVRASSGGGGGSQANIVLPTWARAGERTEGPTIKFKIGELIPFTVDVFDSVGPVDLRALNAKFVVSPPGRPLEVIAELTLTPGGTSFNVAQMTATAAITRSARQLAWAIRVPGSKLALADGRIEVSNAPLN